MARSNRPVLYDGGAMAAEEESNANSEAAAPPGSPRRCPDCHSRVSHRPHETVCLECGLVVDDEQTDHGPEWRDFEDGTGSTLKRCNDGGLTATHHDKGLGSEIGYSKTHDMSRLRTHNKRARFESGSERSQAYANGAIKRVIAALDLPSSLAARACQLYKKAQERDLLKGRSIEWFVGGAVYAACREVKLGRLPEEIAEVVRLSEADLDGHTTPTDAIQMVYSILCRKLDLKPKPPVPSDYIPRVISGVDATRQTNAVALELAQVADGHGKLAGCAPSGIAAACVHTAADITGDDFTQRVVAEVAGVTPVTVRASGRRLKALDGVKHILLGHDIVPETPLISDVNVSERTNAVAQDLVRVTITHSELATDAPGDVAAACVALAADATDSPVTLRALAEEVSSTPAAVQEASEQIESLDTDAVENVLLKHGVIPKTFSARPPSPPSSEPSRAGVSAD